MKHSARSCAHFIQWRAGMKGHLYPSADWTPDELEQVFVFLAPLPGRKHCPSADILEEFRIQFPTQAERAAFLQDVLEGRIE